jgi:hypothetical protein
MQTFPRHVLWTIFCAVAVLLASAAIAQDNTATLASKGDTPKGPAQRGLVWAGRADLESQVLARWGTMRAGGTAGTDLEDFGKAVRSASEARLIRALTAPDSDTFMSRLSGGRSPAEKSRSTAANLSSRSPHAGILSGGTAIQELEFVAVAPCRIFDTRFSTAGRLLTGVNRNLYSNSSSSGPTTWANQGGDASLCTSVPFDPPAIAVTLTVINQVSPPPGFGWVTAWAYGGSVPNASTLNWPAPGMTANTTVIPTCYACGPDFTVVSFGNTDLIGDIVGYYRANDKTIDAHVLDSPLLNSATVGVSTGQGINLPGAGANPYFVSTLVLPNDYSPNTDLTAVFSFTAAPAACTLNWNANSPNGTWTAGAPFQTLNSTPLNQILTSGTAGNVFNTAVTLSSAAAMYPHDFLTVSWYRPGGDTCGSAVLKAMYLLYQ